MEISNRSSCFTLSGDTVIRETQNRRCAEISDWIERRRGNYEFNGKNHVAVQSLISVILDTICRQQWIWVISCLSVFWKKYFIVRGIAPVVRVSLLGSPTCPCQGAEERWSKCCQHGNQPESRHGLMTRNHMTVTDCDISNVGSSTFQWPCHVSTDHDASIHVPRMCLWAPQHDARMTDVDYATPRCLRLHEVVTHLFWVQKKRLFTRS